MLDHKLKPHQLTKLTLYLSPNALYLVASNAVSFSVASSSFNIVAAFSHSGFKFLQCPHPGEHCKNGDALILSLNFNEYKKNSGF